MTKTICLVGNPNSGKTSIFNILTGARQRVGNWAGVTVEHSEGEFLDRTRDTEVRVVDLPGLYSLHAAADDERVARDALMSGDYDLVVNVVDATNLERNLYLTSQLLELGVPMMVVLTMTDLAEGSGIAIDYDHLEHHLGLPVLPVNAMEEREQERIRAEVSEQAASPTISHHRVEYPPRIAEVVDSWSVLLSVSLDDMPFPPRWLALLVLDGDRSAEMIAEQVISPEEIESTRHDVEHALEDEVDILIADSRFGFVHGVAEDVTRTKSAGGSVTEKVDSVVLHPILGIPVFLAVMYGVFWVTIALGGAAIDFFDILGGTVFVEGPRAVLQSLRAPAWAELVVADGIGAGIQTVATFVPIIFAMFLMLSLLENSGYMARAAFVMDRTMRRIGLPGKSFVPLLVGFGCTVPAIISTRTLESRKDRLMTVFIAPLMSCGARLPVYALFAAAFFPRAGGLVVFSLYLAGIAVAILTGLLLKNTLFPGSASHLVMELPPYHRPHLRATLVYTWTRMKSFVVNAGATIAVAVAILAILNAVQWGDSGDTVLARAGKAATPVFRPIGIDEENWPATVGLFTGLFAKEAIVGTLNSLYTQEAGGGDSAGVGDDRSTPGLSASPLIRWVESIPSTAGDALRSLWSGIQAPGLGLSAEHGAGAGDISRLRGYFTPAQAYAYLLFVLLYLPCLAAFGAAVRELGSGYGSMLAVYLIGIAWSVSSLFYQIVEGHSLATIGGALLVLAGLVAMFALVGRRSAGALGVQS